MFDTPAADFEVIMKRVVAGLLLFGLIELALLVKAGEVFGTWFPIVAVVLSMAAGGQVIRHYGFQTVNRLRDVLRTGAAPAGPRPAGIAGVLAGILLILPGFLSDLAAVVLLIPMTRRIVASALGWRIGSTRVSARRQTSRGPVIEAEAVEIHGEMGAKQHICQPSPWRR